MPDQKSEFNFYTHELKPNERRFEVQFSRPETIKDLVTTLGGYGLIIDENYGIVRIQRNPPLFIARGIGSIEAVRTIQESDNNYTFFSEPQIGPT